MAQIRVEGFDHLVLVVADVERSVAWYHEVLGLEPVRLDEWRDGTAPFPSVRVDAGTIIDFIPRRGDGQAAGANVDHLCLVVEPTDLSGFGETGPRFGARGIGTSVYIQDPDGNTVELRHYGSPAQA